MFRNRKLKNFFLNASLSRRYYVAVFMIGLLTLAVVQMYAIGVVREIVELFASVDQSLDIPFEGIYASLNKVIVMFFVMFFGYTFFTALFVMLIEYRVSGPKVAIMWYIDQLKKGEYGANRNLRKNDELKEIMDSLQELAKILESRGEDKV